VAHPDLELIAQALERRPAACRALVDRLTPTIQQRVSAALIRRRRGSRQELLDLTQEVFRILLDEDGRALKAWDPARGASLNGYVALIADRRVASVLRSGRQSGWAEDAKDPLDFEELDDTAPTPEEVSVSRDMLAQLLEILRAGLSERGFEMFHWLYVEEREVEWIVARSGLNRNAVYAWRARLQKTIAQAAVDLSSDRPASRRRESDEVHE
jgi:DNA-directed RNA polymerase specialized sigma24 family protein